MAQKKGNCPHLARAGESPEGHFNPHDPKNDYANILSYKVYQQMELGDIPLKPVDTSLYGFACRHVLNAFQVIVSTYPMKLNFLAGIGVYIPLNRTQFAILQSYQRTKNFAWDESYQQAFQNLKTYLLTKPVPGEPLYLYLAMGQHAVSSVLTKEEKGHQKPFCYVSQVLRGTEQWYLEVEKLVFALVIIARPGAAKFANEATYIEDSEGKWLLHVDYSSNLAGSEVGVVLTSPEGDVLEYALRFDSNASHNEAEYEPLIISIKMTLDVGARNPIAYFDS
ncbi:hypothetical protein Sango_1257800 [Sesamum angolense]|uniref:Reverse transcriptase/retrotransposon-derived protein RNase H-like domain-containing protein n=1 Tax=Sesamum angolense TaxID=2727404 RepID=A0AAE1WQJ1_9LAMI|nr:hypothetical protein Sango_1257800 [Sesamum angolense]